MDDYYSCKRSGQIQVQIPAFGDWDNANKLPITQYFESARQAGLIRYSSSSGEGVPYVGAGDLYAVDMKKPSRSLPPQRKNSRVRDKAIRPHVSEQIKRRPQKQQGGKVDLKAPAPARHHCHPPLQARPPKPVDEDLYKIPPELLRTSKRNKMRGLFSRCLVPSCDS